MSQRKLRVGMVGGGGPSNFFGGPHRRAILIDNSAELTAGALRSTAEESIASAKELFMPRGYASWDTMIKAEAGLPDGERIDSRKKSHSGGNEPCGLARVCRKSHSVCAPFSNFKRA